MIVSNEAEKGVEWIFLIVVKQYVTACCRESVPDTGFASVPPGFGECGSVGIRAAGSERDVEPYAGTDFSNFVSGIPDRVAAFLFRYFASAKYK